jgi:hypothetical protein
MSAKDYVYQSATVLLILERHRNKGTTSRQVKQAIWQAEQAIRALERLLKCPALNLDSLEDEDIAARDDAIKLMHSVMPEPTKQETT